MEAIETRRSIPKLQDTAPSKELLVKVLEASKWAPNHYHTEPWAFEVLFGEGRNKLGSVYGRINVESLGDEATEEDKKVAYEKGLIKARRAPVVIVVKVQPFDHERIVFVEEVAATACAVQNMLLTAHSLNLGAMWRTGKPAYHSLMKDTFDLTGNGTILGFIYLGFPLRDRLPSPPKKRPLEEFVQWIDHA